MRSKKLTISGAIILASVVLDASAMLLGPDVKNVLDKNPQLRQVQNFPSIRFNPGEADAKSETLRAAFIGDCGVGPSSDLNLTAGEKRKCLKIEFRKAEHAYESDFEKTRHYEAVLAPNSPKVVRVYEVGLPGARSKGSDVSRLLAEFDLSGRLLRGPGQEFLASRDSSSGPASRQAPPSQSVPSDVQNQILRAVPGLEGIFKR